MRKLVLSQPMFLPWRGMFEQIKLCDVFVFYDNVQLPMGGGKGRGFTTRVQLKTQSGVHWLSVPIRRTKQREQLIQDSFFVDLRWRRKHVASIRQAYSRTPFFEEVFEAVVKSL